MIASTLWDRFQKYYLRYEDLGFSLDTSRMRFSNDFLTKMQPRRGDGVQENGGTRSGSDCRTHDENRMVGHYWLRNPDLAPDASAQKRDQADTLDIHAFAGDVRTVARVTAQDGAKFTDVLVVGIGGSALGPQFVAEALGGAGDRMAVHFLDNTDPDGFDKLLDKIAAQIIANTRPW